MTLLFDMLRKSARAHPDGLAIVDGETRLTYRDLEALCLEQASQLVSQGVSAGVPVALILPNCVGFVTGFFGLAAADAIAVPLNIEFKDDELAYYLREAGIRHVIIDQAAAERCEGIAAALDWELTVMPVPLRPPLPGSAPSAVDVGENTLGADVPFLYQYSSGTTGLPKRVIRTHGQVRAEADHFTSTCAVGPQDRIFCAVPLFHAHGLGNCMLAAVRAGATLVIMPDPQPFVLKRQAALKLMQQEQVTIFPGVPFLFEALSLGKAGAELPSLRLCFSAGSSLPTATYEAFRNKYGIPVRQLYGSTETGSVSINLAPDPDATCESVGTPMRDVSVHIIDETGEPLPTGEEGELAIASPAMTDGYFGMEEVNRTAFRDGRFVPGDSGFMDEQGNIYLTGRKRGFIEVVGHKVDPGMVEKVIGDNPAVREAAVLGVKDAATGTEKVKAVVVLETPCTEEEMLRYCREHLASFEVPQILEFRDELPKSPLGKILRKYLVEPA